MVNQRHNQTITGWNNSLFPYWIFLIFFRKTTIVNLLVETLTIINSITWYYVTLLQISTSHQLNDSIYVDRNDVRLLHTWFSIIWCHKKYCFYCNQAISKYSSGRIGNHISLSAPNLNDGTESTVASQSNSAS